MERAARSDPGRYLLVDESAYPRADLEALSSPVADLFRIEKSHDWLEVQASAQRLQQSLSREESSLREAFGTWLRKVILPRLGAPPEEISDLLHPRILVRRADF